MCVCKLNFKIYVPNVTRLVQSPIYWLLYAIVLQMKVIFVGHSPCKNRLNLSLKK